MMPKQELLDSRASSINASVQNELGWGDRLFIYHGWQRLGKFVPARLGWLLSPRFLKFCAVGLSGIVVNMGVLYILTDLCGLFYMFSSPIAIECSFLSNFFLNDVWTWKGVGDPGATERLRRLGKFHVVYAAGLAINLSLLYVVTEHLGLYYLLANLIAIAIATMWNFWWSARWTWASLQAK